MNGGAARADVWRQRRQGGRSDEAEASKSLQGRCRSWGSDSCCFAAVMRERVLKRNDETGMDGDGMRVMRPGDPDLLPFRKPKSLGKPNFRPLALARRPRIG